MTNECSHKGVATIQEAIESMLEKRGVAGGVITHDARGSEPINRACATRLRPASEAAKNMKSNIGW
jgi:hypothetical protein